MLCSWAAQGSRSLSFPSLPLAWGGGAKGCCCQNCPSREGQEHSLQGQLRKVKPLLWFLQG